MNEIRVATIKRTLQRYQDHPVPRGPEPPLLDDCVYLLQCLDDARIQLAKERHYRHVAERQNGRIG